MNQPLMIVCLIVAAALPLASSQEASAAIIGTTAYAETLPEGQTVVGARIELPAEANAADVTFSTFAVTGYDVIGTYVNDTGEWRDAAPTGRYIFLEFAVDPVPGSSTGKTLQYFDSANSRFPINLDIRQNEPIVLANDNVVNPSAFTNTDEVNLLVDDFLSLSFTDSTGFEVKYRLFVPEGYEDKDSALEELPLVIFFHGSGEGGLENDVQLLGNPSALEFAKPEAQAEHPAFVMAPQSVTFPDTGGSWATNLGTDENPNYSETPSLHAAIEALYDVMDRYSIDKDRVYGTGLSQGSRGIWTSSMMHPDLYAAQLNVASADIYSDEQLRPLVDKPIWTLVAVDDDEERVTQTGRVVDQLEALGAVVNRKVGENAFNGYLRGYEANQEVQAQWDEADEQGASLLLTHFVAGTVQPNAHWSWMYSFNNNVLRDWLFSHSR